MTMLKMTVMMMMMMMMMQVHFANGEYIIRQDARGDTFYIIASGRVSRANSQ